MSVRDRYFSQEGLWKRDETRQEIDRIAIVRQTWPDSVYTVLEVGCGSGTLLNYISWCNSCVGIDRSRIALQEVRWPAVQGDVAALPFKDSSFDVVICADVLEHLSDADFESAVRELQRVSARHLLVISPHGENLSREKVVCQRCMCEFHPNGHVRSFSRKQLEELFLPNFYARQYTYFGDAWRQLSPLVATVERNLGVFNRDVVKKAICPQCGLQLDGNYRLEGIDEIEHAMAWLEHFFAFEPETVNECEVMVWLEQSRAKRPLPNKGRFWVQTEGACGGFEIGRRDVGEIDMEDPGAQVVPNALRHSILITSELTDWGEVVTDPEGGICRMFKNRGDTDGHALMAFPTSLVRKRESIRIGLRDLGPDSCYVQIFIAGVGYHTLGIIGGLGNGHWIEKEFNIDGLAPLARGVTIVRLITSKPHPALPLPVGRVALLPAVVCKESLDIVTNEATENLPIPDNWIGEELVCTVQSQNGEFALLSSDASDLGHAFLGRGQKILVPDWYIKEQLSERFHSHMNRTSTAKRLTEVFTRAAASERLEAYWPIAATRLRKQLAHVDRILRDDSVEDNEILEKDAFLVQEGLLDLVNGTDVRYLKLLELYYEVISALRKSYFRLLMKF